MPRPIATTTTISPEPLSWRDRPLLPVALAATLLGRSRAGVYQMAAEGQVRLVKLGGRTLAKTEDVAALIEAAQPFVPNAAPRGRAKQIRDRAA